MKYIQGDLLEAFDKKDIDILGHCENSLGLSYFKGIAKSIHKKFEGLTEAHVKYCKGQPFGTILVHPVHDQYVINIYGQFYKGGPSNDKTIDDSFQIRTQALTSALQELNNTMYLNNFSPKLKIGLPLICSGLASDLILKAGTSDLNYFKKYIAHIVEDNLTNFDVTIYYL